MGAVQGMMDAVLGDMIATGAILDPAATYVAPFTAITDKGVLTLASDITFCTGAMQTRDALTTFGSIYHEPDGRAVCDAPAKVFSPASSAEAQTVIGWALMDASTAGNLIYYEYLPVPLPMPDEFTKLTIVVRPTADPLGRWSAAVTWDGSSPA